MTEIVQRLRANDAEIHLPILGEAADCIKTILEALEKVISELEQGYVTSALESAKEAVRQAK